MNPIRWHCNKVLPLVYDDSLSYYEVLCKLTSKINEVIDEMGTLHSEYEKMYSFYVDFKNEVDRVILPKLSELDTKMGQVMTEVAELNQLVVSLYNYSKNYTDTELAKAKADIEWEVNTQINMIEKQILELQKEIENVHANITVFNPVTGFKDTLEATVKSVYDSARLDEGLTVGEYYASGVTVGEYDNMRMSVKQYAMIGKKIIHRFYKWFYNPYTGIKNTVENIASWNAGEILGTMSVTEYDGLNLTVADYEGLNLTVADYLRYHVV